MKVLLFGAAGMVGQGALKACLEDPEVGAVVAVGRSPAGASSPKFSEILLPNLADLSPAKDRLSGFDACFFCLGVSSIGMTEADYARLTHDLTLSAARLLSALNPKMAFIYVSGLGTDGTERGRVMWARVKGRTENDLRALPLSAYAFRPGFIEPVEAAKLKNRTYRVLFTLIGPLLPLFRFLMPSQVLTAEQIGRAMLSVARRGYPKPVLEIADIRAAAAA